MSLPSHASVVIIGGGIIGCSHRLPPDQARRKDVLLLERKQLTSGTTWHAAGLVRAMLSTAQPDAAREIHDRSLRRAGGARPARRPASCSTARSPSRPTTSAGRSCSAAPRWRAPSASGRADQRARSACRNVAADERRRPRRRRLLPARTASTNPDRHHAWRSRKGAPQRRRAHRREHGKVTSVLDEERPRGRRRRPRQATVQRRDVVNCAGMWARELGTMAGVDVPLHACEHFYIVTEPMQGLSPTTCRSCATWMTAPTTRRTPASCCSAPSSRWPSPGASTASPRISASTSCRRTSSTSSRCSQGAMHRVPSLAETGIRKFFNGPESFTPDERYLLGRGARAATELRSSPPASTRSASSRPAAPAWRWPTGSSTAIRRSTSGTSTCRRSMPHQNSKSFLDATASPKRSACSTPCTGRYRQPETARGVAQDRRSTSASRRAAPASAKSPAGSAPTGSRPRASSRNTNTATGARTGSSTRAAGAPRRAQRRRPVRPVVVRQVHRARARRRERAQAHLRQRRRVPAGRVVYTQWLNERGGIEADLTVTRLADDALPGRHRRRDRPPRPAWLKRHIPAQARAVASSTSPRPTPCSA